MVCLARAVFCIHVWTAWQPNNLKMWKETSNRKVFWRLPDVGGISRSNEGKGEGVNYKWIIRMMNRSMLIIHHVYRSHAIAVLFTMLRVKGSPALFWFSPSKNIEHVSKDILWQCFLVVFLQKPFLNMLFGHKVGPKHTCSYSVVLFF